MYTTTYGKRSNHNTEIVVKSLDFEFHELALRKHSDQYPRNIHFGWRIEKSIMGDQRKRNNNLRTARYTKRNWVFASLFNQIKKLANIYFIVITLLAFFPGSPKSPFFSILTVAVMLTFLVIKDGREDRVRRKTDDLNNLTNANVYSYSKMGFV